MFEQYTVLRGVLMLYGTVITPMTNPDQHERSTRQAGNHSQGRNVMEGK